jgi:hypothetical protein
MPAEPVLKLHLLDIFDEPINEAALVTFRNQSLSEVLNARSVAGKSMSVRGLRGSPNGLYRVEADPAAYLASSRFIDVAASGTTEAEMYFAVDPRRVKKVSFPAFNRLSTEVRRLLDASKSIGGFEGKAGAKLYGGLDDLRRAGFLNIIAKCGVTALPSGRSVLSHIEELRDLRGDRFFCVVPQQLRDDVKNATQAALFNEVDGSLHHPPDGFEPAGSFKTPDHYVNLQLTFFASADEWVADIDIDDANGLAHVFQVLRNELTGRPTHPFDIHQILKRHQSLDTGYRLEI